MAYITEEMLFEYFQEMGKPVHTRDMQDYFDNVKLSEMLQCAGALEMKRYVVRDSNGFFTLTDKAWKEIAEKQEGARKAAEREELEIEKTKTDLELAKRTLKDYNYTKWFARISLVISVGLAVLELVKLLIQ